MEVKGEKLEIGYDGRIVVRGMDITVKKGEITTIIGPNGSGKSTLLKALTRLLRCSMGCVYLNKEDLYNIDSKKLAKCIGVLPQRHCAPPDFKVRDLVGYGRVPYQKWYEQKRKNENCRIYILEDAGAPVGQVRADRDERGESAEISYAIAERARGKGYASWMLAAAEKQLSEKGFCRELLAEVKNDNIASQKVFQKLGYEEQREDYGFSYRRAIGQNADGK